MGGSAFTRAPHLLNTPRMPPEVYRHMVAHCQVALSSLFRTVTAPVEAPAKADFGDVDFLVADPIDTDADKTPKENEPLEEGMKSKPGEPPAIWKKIEHTLGAVRFKYNGKDTAANLALPWPRIDGGSERKSMDENPTSSQQLKFDDDYLEHNGKNTRALDADADADADAAKDEEDPTDNQQTPNDYIQVDVRICSTVKRLLWAAFKHAHGDMWQLLGTIIRPLGLKADETALYLIAPEIEPLNKKRAMVFLSDDPAQVCEFLGLSHADGQWEKPFDSNEDMFAYAAQCRFFWLWPQQAADDDDDDKNKENTLQGPLSPTRTQKANDRRRLKTRHVYRAWVDDFVPRLRAQGLHTPPAPLASLSRDALRDHVREECFAAFPGTRDLYTVQLTAWTAERQELEVRTGLIKAVASEDAVSGHPGYDPVRGNSRGVVLAALKRIIMDSDTSYGGIAPASSLRNADGTWRINEVDAWLRGNWAAVAEVAWDMHRAKCAENMKAKLKKKSGGGG